MWLWIWLLLFLIIFCVWNKLQTIKNAQNETRVPVSIAQQETTAPVHGETKDMVQQKDMMLKLSKENGTIKLSGVFPSEKAVEKTRNLLKAQGLSVEKGAIIIDHYADNPKLMASIPAFAKSLSALKNGYIEYKEKTFTVDGVVEDASQKETIVSAIAAIGEEYRLKDNITLQPSAKTVTPAASHETNISEKKSSKPEAAAQKEQQETREKSSAKKAEEENRKAQEALNNILKNKRVEFVYASDRLTPKSRKIIDQIVAILKKYPDVQVEIGGHTDSDGAARRNLLLSQKRAEAVKRYLVRHGIPAKRLVAKGYGESKPLVKNDTRAHKQINRRVEFKVIK